MFSIQKFSKSDILSYNDQFVALLKDSVDGGASVSFLPPLPLDVAQSYWLKIANEVEAGERFLIAAMDQGVIAGSVQLALALQPNGAHRAEVQKLLVLSAYRRRGIATKLLDAVEQAAREARRSLLVLDTEQGSGAEQLYEKYGYCRAGIIPNYAIGGDGDLHGTVLFYRHLASE